MYLCMENSELDRVIYLLKEKVEQLLVANSSLQKANTQLSREVESLLIQSAEQQSELDSLRRRVESASLTDAFVVSMGSKKEARNTIKTILREVDDCIALINK